MLRDRSVGLPAVALFLAAASPPVRAQEVKPGGEETIVIEGFVSGSLLVDDQFFAPGNEQNAIWAALPEVEEDEWFQGGDVRNTRLTLLFRGPELFGDWRAGATVEFDFFGGFAQPSGGFADEQPEPRLRLAYADLTDGRTTLRVGQSWSLTRGYFPESLTHLGFPLGWGAGGLIGWRFPGVFVYRELSRRGARTVRLSAAAFRGSWVPEEPAGAVSPGEAVVVPQLEARLDFERRPRLGAPIAAFVAGHVDRKDLDGVGDGDGFALPEADGDDDLTGWAVSGGFRTDPGRWTLLGNAYVGEAIGQLFAQILQFGDFAGWGAQGQVGYRLTERWSVWALLGVDDPDEEADDVAGVAPFRARNVVFDALLRYRVGPYALGVEWYRARTDWRLFDVEGRAFEEDVTGNQVALSVRYDI